MAEPVENLLSRFTPDGRGLDRDALLFAAGRASVRPRRGWQVAAGVLAASQLLTLLLLWPHSMREAVPVVQQLPPSVQAPVPSQPPPLQEKLEAWAMRQQLLQAEGEISPVQAGVETLVPDAPPLHAFVRSLPPDLD
jgi:hypothetical protein